MIAQNHLQEIAVQKYGDFLPKISYIVAQSRRGLIQSGHAVFTDGATVKLGNLARHLLKVLDWKEVEILEQRTIYKTAVYRPEA